MFVYVCIVGEGGGHSNCYRLDKYLPSAIISVYMNWLWPTELRAATPTWKFRLLSAENSLNVVVRLLMEAVRAWVEPADP